MRAVLAVITLLACAVAAHAGRRPHPDEVDVVELTTVTFNVALVQRKHVLVEFYSPTCGTCNDFRPLYASLATAIKGIDPDVVVAKVNALAEASLAERFHVAAYPAIKWFESGKEVATFPGDLSHDRVLEWVRKLIGAPSRVLATVDELREVAAAEVAMVAYFDKFEGEEHAMFEQMALEQHDVVFAETKDAAVAAELGLKVAPGYAVSRNYSGHPFASAVYEGHPASKQMDDTPLERLEQFLGIERLPDVLVYGADTMEQLSTQVASVPIGFHVYIAAPAEQVQPGSPLHAVAVDAGRKLRGKALVMVHALAPGQPNPLYEFFEVDAQAQHPQVVGSEWSKWLKYKFTGGEVTAEAVVAFANGLEHGTPQRIYNSAPVPEEVLDSDGVTIAVGTTLETLAKDPTKDVLLEVYAPWCENCQRFAPTLGALARLLRETPSVRVAKIDKDENEHPELDNVTTLPTLLFYAAEEGAEAVPITVEGGADLQSLVNFLEANAKVRFTPPDPKRVAMLDVSKDGDYADDEDEEDAPAAAKLRVGGGTAPSRDEL